MQRALVTFADGTVVAAEVADTDEAQARGLMFRDALGERQGMLFGFDVPRRFGFWMRNVRMPLDILWLDESGRVVWMVESAPPCTGDPCPMYVPETKASRVVELQGGFVHRHRVALGDLVRIELPRRHEGFATKTRRSGHE